MLPEVLLELNALELHATETPVYTCQKLEIVSCYQFFFSIIYNKMTQNGIMEAFVYKEGNNTFEMVNIIKTMSFFIVAVNNFIIFIQISL